jgi:hypothetical protein
MKRRNLIKLLAGTLSGLAFMNPTISNVSAKDATGKKENINSSLSPNVIYASRAGVRLDSNVITGGGTDDTKVIQAILNKATKMGNLHFIMDGASLVCGLTIHSNTVIECLNSSCGFFLAPQSNQAVIKNANPNHSGERKDKNILLLGGTYNQNCKEQVHHVTENGKNRWVFAMEFYGVENFTMRDVTIRNQRTFAMLMSNWFRVNMENISIDLPDRVDKQNQDGLHFWGPGQFLTIRNIQGNSGDDFLALAPDENDGVSDITDVLIDGVFLNDADQGIRLLSGKKGRLDRVIIKNVTGTYKSFGFYVDPWFGGGAGNFGSIVFDTINLRQSTPNYTYTLPFLFRIGGKIESLILRNISHHNPSDNRSVIDIGWPKPRKVEPTYIKSLLIEGLQIYESDDKAADTSYIKVMAQIDNLIVRNSDILRTSDTKPNGCLIESRTGTKIKTLIMNNISVNKINSLLLHKEGEIETVQLNNVLGSDLGKTFIDVENGNVQKIYAGEFYGAELVSTTGNGKVEKINR